MKTIIITILTLFVLAFTYLCPTANIMTTARVYADVATSLDSTYVMDDLQDTDLSEIVKNYDGDGLYVISFLEYCFAYDPNANGNFGLYVYVYNPAQKPVLGNSMQNKINFGVEYSGSEVTGYDKFNLRCMSVSDDGKYVKFKIVDKESSVTGETILQRLCAQKTQRIYDIAEIEVCHTYGEIADFYVVGKRYIYTGFAAGYGANANADSTLDVFSETSNVISLDVRPTQYRLDGNNGKNIYTQDSLHSVYFTVPNEYGEKYGEMTAVHAHWLNAVLKPILVTGNQDAYNAILPYLGRDDLSGLDYSYFGALNGPYSTLGGVTGYDYDYGFFLKNSYASSLFMAQNKDHNIKPLYLMFNAGEGKNSADGFIPPSEGEGSLIEKVQQATAKFGGELVEERYSRVLFENVDEAYTDKRIFSTDEFDIRNVGIDKASWWDKLWGGKDKVDQATLNRFVGVKGIEAVTKEVMDLPMEDVCETLKIGQYDYSAFKKYYESNKDNGTVYLFRYRISDYMSQEATLVTTGSFGLSNIVDTNAYFFQTAVDIGFDIIDITLTNEQGEHVIGVAAKPIDIFPTPTPPLITTDDTSFWATVLFWLKMIVGIILVVVLVVFLIFVFPPIGTALLFVILLPFRLIGALFKGIRKAFHKRE